MTIKPNTMLVGLVAGLFAMAAVPSLAAEAPAATLRLPAVISDHAVLQADTPVTLWGWAAPGDAITVKFETGPGSGKAFETNAGPDGRWSGQITALKPGTAGKIVVRTDRGQSLTVNDVLVGQVWLAGGQSNMSYLVETHSKSVNERTTPQLMERARSEATAAGGEIRYFATRMHLADTPLDDVAGSWVVAAPETVGKCFALSWNFGFTLHEKLHQPIGLIDSAVGGTCVEAWTPRPELDACPAGPELEKMYDTRRAKFAPDVRAKFDADLAEWKRRYPTPAEQAEHAATEPILSPSLPNIPARLYNGMIRGLEPYTLKGAIWFQGDGNCYYPPNYGVLIQTMIKAWRAHFRNEHLPFYYVEMQFYRPPQVQPVEPNALSDIREQQQAALALPDTDVATAVDQGIDIPNYEAHFPDKRPLGQRLAGLALDHLYGQPGPARSPQFKSAMAEGKILRIQFDHADGLRLRGGELKGFAIRSANGSWQWAQGKIDGQSIVLWNEQVAEPAAVRYGWAWHPLLSVENGAGLPLRPFRTDSPAYSPAGAAGEPVRADKSR
jgi:sialate O-acetylesterase